METKAVGVVAIFLRYTTSKLDETNVCAMPGYKLSYAFISRQWLLRLNDKKRTPSDKAKTWAI
eukprot:scaffold563920_cov19-Prasinocladus_malaysianus.AAC.1